MLLCAQGLYPAKQAEPRAAKPCLHFVPSMPRLRQDLLMPLQPHRPSLFCPLSAEAYLLTRKNDGNGWII